MKDDNTVLIPVRGWWDFDGIKRQKQIENWLDEQGFPCRSEGSIVSRKIVFDEEGDAAHTKFRWSRE
jgi:hypothetical protein